MLVGIHVYMNEYKLNNNSYTNLMGQDRMGRDGIRLFALSERSIASKNIQLLESHNAWERLHLDHSTRNETVNMVCWYFRNCLIWLEYTYVDGTVVSIYLIRSRRALPFEE